jgi:hypothetical protein
MRDFVAGVATRYLEIRRFLEVRDDVGPLKILKKYQFGDLSACISAFNDFRVWSEETSASLSTAGGGLSRSSSDSLNWTGLGTFTRVLAVWLSSNGSGAQLT